MLLNALRTERLVTFCLNAIVIAGLVVMELTGEIQGFKRYCWCVWDLGVIIDVWLVTDVVVSSERVVH